MIFAKGTPPTTKEVFGRSGKFLINWKKVLVQLAASSAAFVFGVAVLFLSLVAVTNPAAVHPKEPEVAVAAENEATPPAVARIEYYLPYPGILPDSPLYKAKMLRDKVVLLFTRNKLKKSDLQLEYANKRVNAAMFLVEGGKGDLGITTLTKAEKYLEQSVNLALDLSREGKDVKSTLIGLDKASKKHLEIIDQMQAKATGNDLKTLEEMEKIVKVSNERILQALIEAK